MTRLSGFVLTSLLLCTSVWGHEVDQHEKAHELADYDGYTVVDFAASWCEPCWKVLPKLQRLAAEMAHIRFLVVSVDEKVEGRDLLVRRLKLTLPVIWDADHRLAERFAPEAMPASFVLDPAGQIIYRHLGSSKKDWASFTKFLESLEPVRSPESEQGRF